MVSSACQIRRKPYVARTQGFLVMTMAERPGFDDNLRREALSTLTKQVMMQMEDRRTFWATLWGNAFALLQVPRPPIGVPAPG